MEFTLKCKQVWLLLNLHECRCHYRWEGRSMRHADAIVRCALDRGFRSSEVARLRLVDIDTGWPARSRFVIPREYMRSRILSPQLTRTICIAPDGLGTEPSHVTAVRHQVRELLQALVTGSEWRGARLKRSPRPAA